MPRGITTDFETHYRGCDPHRHGITVASLPSTALLQHHFLNLFFCHSRGYYRGNCGITAVAVTVSFSSEHSVKRHL